MIDEVAFLIKKQAKSKTSDGYDAIQEIKTEVFVKEKATSRNEFYQAARAGMRIDKTLVMSRWDYSGEVQLEHDGNRYKIERTYPLNAEEIELICSEM